MPSKRRRATRGSRPPKFQKVPQKGVPERRWPYRASVYSPLHNEGRGGYVSPCKILGRPGQMFTSKAEAQAVASEAMALLDRRGGSEITVEQIREQWLARTYGSTGEKLKDSTHLTNADRTAKLVARFGQDHPLVVVDQMLAFCRGLSPVYRAGVKAMFAWAVEEGLLSESPVEKLKVKRNTGHTVARPATQAQMATLLEAARQIYPDVADWIEFGSLVGTRPGETDVLRFSDFNADFTRVQILRAFNVKTRLIETPKKVHVHWINVPARAAQIVREQRIRHRGEYVFVNTQGGHWTTTSRQYHWNRIMEAAGFRRREGGKWVMDFNTKEATRHYCGWWLINAATPPCTSEEVAIQLRHSDYGDLVRHVYGKRDHALAIDAVAAAYDNANKESKAA